MQVKNNKMILGGMVQSKVPFPKFAQPQSRAAVPTPKKVQPPPAPIQTQITAPKRSDSMPRPPSRISNFEKIIAKLKIKSIISCYFFDFSYFCRHTAAGRL